MSEACKRARVEMAIKILDRWEARRDLADLREPSLFDVRLFEVRHSCVQWDGCATKIAGAIHDYLGEFEDPEVAPL